MNDREVDGVEAKEIKVMEANDCIRPCFVDDCIIYHIINWEKAD